VDTLYIFKIAVGRQAYVKRRQLNKVNTRLKTGKGKRMKYLLFISFISIGMVTASFTSKQAVNRDTSKEPSPTAKNLQFRDLFNGKNLSGWINVNTAKDTWNVRDGILVCSGHPIGVLRTERQYENFILQVEWNHQEAGGNSGIFVWSEGEPPQGKRLPKGVEVQALELEWSVQHKATDAYVHGEIFGTGGLKTKPDNPRGSRSKSWEKRCKGKGQWNQYTIVCVDGVIKLSVNGKFVNGISNE